MNSICYIIDSEKLIFKSENPLYNYMINSLASKCFNRKELNKKMSDYFKRSVRIADYSEILILGYNGEYEVVIDELGKN